MFDIASLGLPSDLIDLRFACTTAWALVRGVSVYRLPVRWIIGTIYVCISKYHRAIGHNNMYFKFSLGFFLGLSTRFSIEKCLLHFLESLCVKLNILRYGDTILVHKSLVKVTWAEQAVIFSTIHYFCPMVSSVTIRRNVLHQINVHPFPLLFLLSCTNANIEKEPFVPGIIEG